MLYPIVLMTKAIIPRRGQAPQHLQQEREEEESSMWCSLNPVQQITPHYSRPTAITTLNHPIQSQKQHYKHNQSIAQLGRKRMNKCDRIEWGLFVGGIGNHNQVRSKAKSLLNKSHLINQNASLVICGYKTLNNCQRNLTYSPEVYCSQKYTWLGVAVGNQHVSTVLTLFSSSAHSSKNNESQPTDCKVATLRNTSDNVDQNPPSLKY